MSKRKKNISNFPEVNGWRPFNSSNSKKETIKAIKEKKVDQQDVPPGWREPPFTKEQNPHGKLFSCTAYSALFPKYREKYLREVWPAVKTILLEHHIKAELDALEGTMLVKTTTKTFDPFIILKARDMIKLLARSVPLEQAQRVLADDVYSDIIEIDIPNRERFIRRRERLIGPDGATLKAIELLTGCYVLIQGKTVSAVGPYDGLKQVRQISQDTMRNIHPVYNIKTLLIKKKLSADPNLKDENWQRFLPTVKHKNLSKRRKPFKIQKKKEYNPFPPPQPLSKIDQELEDGTYFISAEERERMKKKNKLKKNPNINKQKQRMAAFIPPKENVG